jgi:hypothetical protein
MHDASFTHYSNQNFPKTKMKIMKKRVIKTAALALIISATLFSCKKENAEPAQEGISSAGTEQILASENGVATATQAAIGSNVILTLQPGNLDGEDAMVADYALLPYNTTNFGQVIDFPALTWTAGGIPTYRRSLIKFTQLSYIPPSATIVSAKLTLYGVTDASKAPDCTQGNSTYPNGYAQNPCFLKQLNGPWSESTVTWNSILPFITGTQVAIPATSQQWNENKTITLPNSWVQGWVSTPSSNNGVMLQLQSENPYTSIVFGSSEAATANKRPKLVIKYHL